MKILKDNPQEVTKEQLRLKLLAQAECLEDATPYRKRTVQLALEVLDRILDVRVFTSRTLTLTFVVNILKDEDQDRRIDVAKMLYTQRGYLYNELNYSDEFKKLKEESKRNCKDPTITFKKVKLSELPPLE